MSIEDRIGVLAGELRTVSDEIERKEAELSALKQRKQTITEEELPALMLDAEMTKASFQGIGTIYLDHRLRARVSGDDLPGFCDWLKEHGHGPLVKETVPWQTLEAWAKEMWSEGNALPEVVKVHTAPIARLRRK